MSRTAQQRIAVFCLIILLCLTVRAVIGEEIASTLESGWGSSDTTHLASQPVPGAEIQPQTPPPEAPRRRTVRPDRRPSRTTPAPDTQSTRRARASAGSPVLRLASVPNMLGDFFHQGQTKSMVTAGMADIPLAGGASRTKISENNKALPMNRFYFTYNHFHNALLADTDITAGPPPTEFNVNRYTIGMEKTFLDDFWSVDVRMPFTNSFGMATPNFNVQGGDIGNLSITLKRLLAATNTTALAAGLGIDTPTGSDVTGRIQSTSYTIHNEAVHLSPFIGFLNAPNDRIFFHGFAQLDVAANGNPVTYVDVISGTFGKLTDQTLMHLDLSGGYWLYRNRYSGWITGVASIIEFHYTTTLNDADIVIDAVTPNTLQFGNRLNRVDMVNLTAGLHAQLGGRTTVRVAGVFPFQGRMERPFDAELQVSLNRRF